MELRRKRARERALQHIQSSVEAFSAEMEDSDSNEEEADEKSETSEELTCIICHQQQNENPLGFIGYSQQSSILNRNSEPAMYRHDPQNDRRVDTTTHLSFCGHVMHLSCFDPFFARTVQIAAGQENFMFDPNKGQYHCPLCKRLNNILLPCYPVEEIDLPNAFSYDAFLGNLMNVRDASDMEESNSVETHGNISHVVRRVFSSFFQRLGMDSHVDANTTIPVPSAYYHGLQAVNIRFLTCFGFVCGNQSNVLWNAMEGILKAVVYTIQMDINIGTQGLPSTVKFMGHTLMALRACLKDADGILQLQKCVRNSVLGRVNSPNLSTLLQRNVADWRIVEDTVSSWLFEPLLQRPLLQYLAVIITVFSDSELFYHANIVSFACLVQIIVSESSLTESKMIVEDDSDIATESSKTVCDIIAIVQSSLATEGVPSLKSVLKRWEAYLEAANKMLSPFSKMEKLPIVWNSSLPQLISLWLGEAGRMVEPIISNSHRIPRLPSLISLPSEYTELHRIVVSVFDLELPAICLVCGAIIDANGKGYCTKHVTNCCGTAGVLFLVQDCSILLMSDGRCCYFPSPYADKHGEKHKQYKGRPLYLDKKRYDAITKLWITHRIPNEVLKIRSSSSRVIIIGHY